MRNQRNFRGQSGRLTSGGGSVERESPFTCVCQVVKISDYTGNEYSTQRVCQGTLNQGVRDCSCCDMRRAESK
jgi:hypothetical protein